MNNFKLLLVVVVAASILITTANATSTVSVSGLSAGAFVAVQYQVAFSSEIVGAAILAGGPYWCANNSLNKAETACMLLPSEIKLSDCYSGTAYFYSINTIDNPSNLRNHKVWLFSGTFDTVVNSGVVKKLQQYYENYGVTTANINTNYNPPAEHAYITDDFGSKCSHLGNPYINNCNFDAAGKLLTHLWGTLQKPVTVVNNSQIITIDQSQYIPHKADPKSVGLNKHAFAYIPKGCANNKAACRLHIDFHGCKQTTDDIQDTYYTKVGLNEWAESNNLIVLYPQAVSNHDNPNGCFDWWGYTDFNYANKLGIQIATVKSMADALRAPSTVIIN